MHTGMNMTSVVAVCCYVLCILHLTACYDNKRPAWTPQGRMGKRVNTNNVYQQQDQLQAKRASWVPQGRFGKRMLNQPLPSDYPYQTNFAGTTKELTDYELDSLDGNQLRVSGEPLAAMTDVRTASKAAPDSGAGVFMLDLSPDSARQLINNNRNSDDADDAITRFGDAMTGKRASWTPQGRFGKKWYRPTGLGKYLSGVHGRFGKKWTPQGRMGKRSEPGKLKVNLLLQFRN